MTNTKNSKASETVPEQIARVTAHDPCIMLGCEHEYGHEGLHSKASETQCANPGPVPVFTHEELYNLWEALAQYVENYGGLPVSDPACTALEKLDRYFSV